MTAPATPTSPGDSSAAPLLVDVFGARWLLDASGLGRPMAERMVGLWRRAAVDPADDPDAGLAGEVRPFVLSRHPRGVVVDGTTHDVPDDAVPYAVSRALTAASIQRRSGECLLLHAAGLCDGDGATLALVGPSGAGKTTAARTLGRSLGYVTDETVAVEEDLTVRAYPKPLSVVVDPQHPTAKVESSPDDAGLATAPRTLRLAAVVVLDRDPDCAEPELTPVGLVDAAVAVIGQTSALLRMPDPLDRLAEALTTGRGPWLLTFRDIADCEPLLRDLLAGRTAPAPPRPWSTLAGPGADDTDHAPVPPLTEADGLELTPATVVRRTRYSHAMHADDGTLVLVGSVPVGLPGLGSTIWRAAAEPCSIAALLDAAVLEHGPHPRALDVTTQTVQVLLASGTLEVVATG